MLAARSVCAQQTRRIPDKRGGRCYALRSLGGFNRATTTAAMAGTTQIPCSNTFTAALHGCPAALAGRAKLLSFAAQRRSSLAVNSTGKSYHVEVRCSSQTFALSRLGSMNTPSDTTPYPSSKSSVAPQWLSGDQASGVHRLDFPGTAEVQND